MDAALLTKALAGLPLGPVRFFATTGSTNRDASAWAAGGAPDLALVVADEQTAGRGRMGRTWLTPAGTALAFSLALRQPEANITRLTALGALAVAEALEQGWGLPAQIKWPNDVLVHGRKLAGVLVELSWTGEQLEAAVLGVGVNVLAGSVPPDAQVVFPATSVEQALTSPPPEAGGGCAGFAAQGVGAPVDRLALLRAVLERLLAWRARLGSPEFLQAWEQRLAWRSEWVQVSDPQRPDLPPAAAGLLLGLQADGALRLCQSNGEEISLPAGELRLRPTR